MRLFRSYPFFTLALMLLIALLAGFQTTLWFQVFGNFPSPMLWLLVISYFAIYRTPREALILSYLAGVTLFFFGVMPLGLWFFNFLILWFLIWIVKERIFWSGAGYFAIASVLTCIAWHILYLLTSYFIESVPVRSFELVDRLLQIFFTPLFAIPIYYLLRFLERLFDQPPIPQAGETLL